ncbi:MAG TPA: hypothetical protein VHF87_11490 [Methylomirabilota bacterium]|nr:hypothetical protein [Methylomirabilota bacterium]
MTGLRPRACRALGMTLLVLGTAAPARMAGAVGEDPAAEVTEALENLGAPGGVWGRLSIEEESPVGASTPLSGVEVTLYPATPALVTELERIRQSARTSGAQHESAVSRVQAALAAHQGRIDRQNPTEGDLVAEPPALAPPRPVTPSASKAPEPRPFAPAAPRTSASPRLRSGAERPGRVATPTDSAEEHPQAYHPWRQRTDPAGLFAFDGVPSGDWVVVAIRVSAYGGAKLRGEPHPRTPGRGVRFLPRATSPAKEAEVWVTRVRIVAADRIGLDLTDRARWLVGPVRVARPLEVP